MSAPTRYEVDLGEIVVDSESGVVAFEWSGPAFRLVWTERGESYSMQIPSGVPVIVLRDLAAALREHERRVRGGPN